MLNTKGLYIKELNTLVGNVAKNFLERWPLLNTKEKNIKEIDIFVGNVAKNFLR